MTAFFAARRPLSRARKAASLIFHLCRLHMHVMKQASNVTALKIASPPAGQQRPAAKDDETTMLVGPPPLPQFAATEDLLTANLSAFLRLWQVWFVTAFGGHKVEGLPFAGASQHDLPTAKMPKSKTAG